MKDPLLIINFKNYMEVAGRRSVDLARAAEAVARKLNVNIIVAPPPASLALVAREVDIPVFAQHLDDSTPGSTTGFMIPELVRTYGVKGSLINHSEHRLPRATIASLVKQLRDLGMTSVVCARSLGEVRTLASMKPDYIAIEPPELIGSGIAVSKARPGVITRSVAAARAGNKVKIVCGAGIVHGADVSAALKLGSRGVLVASGIVKARNWRAKIEELAGAMRTR